MMKAEFSDELTLKTAEVFRKFATNFNNGISFCIEKLSMALVRMTRESPGRDRFSWSASVESVDE